MKAKVMISTLLSLSFLVACESRRYEPELPPPALTTNKKLEDKVTQSSDLETRLSQIKFDASEIEKQIRVLSELLKGGAYRGRSAIRILSELTVGSKSGGRFTKVSERTFVRDEVFVLKTVKEECKKLITRTTLVTDEKGDIISTERAMLTCNTEREFVTYFKQEVTATGGSKADVNLDPIQDLLKIETEESSAKNSPGSSCKFSEEADQKQTTHLNCKSLQFRLDDKAILVVSSLHIAKALGDLAQVQILGVVNYSDGRKPYRFNSRTDDEGRLIFLPIPEPKG